MPRSFKLDLPANWTREPRIVVRVVMGVLLIANLLAAGAFLFPVGGSAEQLEAQIGSLRSEISQRRAGVNRLRSIAARVDQARLGTDQFLGTYFMNRRTASSTMVGELIRLAKEAGLKDKGHAFSFEPVEGSDELTLMTIVGTYEGTYGDLLQFVNRLDKSARFLIVDSLNATPLQGSPNLAITVKMNTFVREGNLAALPATPPLQSAAPAAGPPAAAKAADAPDQHARAAGGRL